jgi:hypothetical protein
VALVLLAAIFVAELFLFDQFGSKRVTSIYPRWNDQIQYLSECYAGYEYTRAHGMVAGLSHTLINPSAQGTLHDFVAVIAFKIVGPSRSAALSLNMLALIAWQGALFFAVGWKFRSQALAFAAAMLPLVLRGPWENVPGSAYDFRLDHFAMCALGVTAAAGLLTEGMRHRAYSAMFGVLAGITLLTRFLTGTYLTLIFGALLVSVLIAPDRVRRGLNWAIASIVALIVAGPILWLNRESVWNYYYIGHYVGPESAIRNQNFGLGRSLQYLIGWLGERHLGSFFGVFAAVITILFIAARIWNQRRPSNDSAIHSECAFARKGAVLETTLLGIAFVLAPALVLTLHPQKSEVVLGALVPGMILLIIAAWFVSGRPDRLDRTLQSSLATMIVITALGYFGRAQSIQFEDPALLANLRQVNALADYIFTTSEAAKLERPRVAVDYITDALDAQVLRVVCYERHRVWKDFNMTLPTGVSDPEAEVVRHRIAESDFVFLTKDGPPGNRYPFDRKLTEMRPELRTWCDDHLSVVNHFVLLGQSLVLYQRRELPLATRP